VQPAQQQAEASTTLTLSTTAPQNHQLSFAQVVTASNSITFEPLPTPEIQGEALTIKISREAYARGLDACKRNLHGKIVLNKRDKPYTSKDIMAKLQKQWKTSENWHMLSLSRSYDEFSFTSYP